MYDIKPYKDHADSPALSMYLLSDDSPEMEKLSCLYCKRTIADVKGTIDRLISTPMPIDDFGIAINIRCKLCHQNYRLIVHQSFQG
jgi:hypothetical protein